MIYILGVDIDDKKPLGYNLCKLYGINYTTALQICSMIGINPIIPFSRKSFKSRLFKVIQRCISGQYNVGTLLKKEMRDSIKLEVQLKTYKGMRHKLKLPVRGQRTHTNRMSQRRSNYLN